MGRMGHFSMGTGNSGLGNPDSGRGKQPLDLSTGPRGTSVQAASRPGSIGWGGGVNAVSMGGAGFFGNWKK
jgi:hypothetical protein